MRRATYFDPYHRALAATSPACASSTAIASCSLAIRPRRSSSLSLRRPAPDLNLASSTARVCALAVQVAAAWGWRRRTLHPIVQRTLQWGGYVTRHYGAPESVCTRCSSKGPRR